MLRKTRIGWVCLVTLPAAALGAPTIVDLGENILPQAVSDNGLVVTGFSIQEDHPALIRWTRKGGVQFLGGMVAGRPDVSADGSTIAAAIATDRIEAAFWSEQSGWVPLSETGLVPALPGWATVPHVISANGERLAGSTTPPPVDYGWERAFTFNPDTWNDRWADYGWQELPKPGKGSIAWASGTSDDGRVQVGSASERSSWYFAVRWVDGKIQELRDGNGMRLGGETVECNSNCTVIVGGGGPSSAVRPVLAWRLLSNSRRPACYFEAIDPTLLALRHYAYSASETGSVVAGAYYYDVIDDSGWGRNVAKGFLWLADKHGGTLVDLQEYLAVRGQPSLRNWSDVVPTSISGDGRYLVGWGVDAQGVIRGWYIDFRGPASAKGPFPKKSRYTRCPTNANTNGATPLSTASDADEWTHPEGVFHAADGRYYEVSSRGASVYGKLDGGPAQELLPLGGGHYYDMSAGMRVSPVRDAAGRLQGIRARQQNRVAIFHRVDE
ncbi:MAG TPA: hypothetical protein VF193_08490 [Steroidobacter sp.]